MSKKLKKIHAHLSRMHEELSKEVESDLSVAWGSGAQPRLAGLGDALELITEALREVDPEMAVKRQCAWYDTARRLCSNCPPPCVPFNGEMKYLDQANYMMLVQHFIAHGPTGTTGIGALEAIETLIDAAESNGNYENENFGSLKRVMLVHRVPVVHQEES